ncbi:putative Ig domain-containing protein [Terriglobus sp.]|uniref:Ig domain-containing protein n=1 Tax=Terriglobus sp. TaxID=1889013 RepID=UPI003B001B29
MQSSIAFLLLLTGVAASDAQSVNAGAKPALVISTRSVPKARLGAPYSAAFEAAGGTPAYNWVAGAGALPDGLELSSAGVLSGTPKKPGRYVLPLVVADASQPQKKALRSVTLTVTENGLIIKSSNPANGTVGQAYAFTVQATGGTGSYTWSVKNGKLPVGLSLSSTSGVISGTPKAVGTSSFTLVVKDAVRADTQTATASITIAAASVAAPPPVANPTGQTTWYVRPDGGTRYSANVSTGQCDGLGDAAYPGKGVNQHCAFNDMRLLWQDGSFAYDNDQQSSFPARGWIGKGGDTYLLRGSIASGATPYRVGWSVPSSACDPALDGRGQACFRGWQSDPYQGMPSPPAGTAAQHTRILGENWQSCHAQGARTPVVAGWGVGSAFYLSNSYTDVQCFDISDRSDCVVSCGGQDFAGVGISIANTADHLTLTDLRIHGMENFGLYGPSGDGSVFTYISLVGNGGGGWNADAGDGRTGSGSLLVQNYEILWNGCGEEYPLVDKLPYRNCRDQSSGGYGDGFGTATVLSNPGWQARFDQGTVAYNTQDGLDALHLAGNGSSMTVTRTLSYGNMGQQVKVGGSQGTLEDSVIVGNCKAMSNPIPGTPAGYNAQLSTFCRAGNQAVLMTAGHGTTTAIRHNTIAGNGALLLGYECDGSAGFCDSTARIDFRDNILVGNPDPIRGNPAANYILVVDGTYPTPAACSAAGDGHHYWTTDGAYGCANDVFFNPGSFNTNNVYFQVKDSCTDHNGAGNLCLDPGLNSATVPLYGYPDFALSARGGAAFGAGTTLTTIPNDYSGKPFRTPPSIGALETGSSLTPYQGQQ